MKPVLFIPGFPGSELRDSATKATVFPPTLSTLIDPAKKSALIQRLIKVPGDLEAGPPIRDILGVARQAQSLYDILSGKFKYDTSNLSGDFAAIGWDWRLSISHAAVIEKLAAEVSRLSTGGRKIVAIVHSTGGLVFRGFLAARPDLISRFEHVMAFGVPWNGTLEALYAITKGESVGFLFARVSAEQGATIMSHAQAAYDLLPPAVLADLSWIPTDAGHAYMRQLAASAHAPFPRNFDDLPVTNVCGWGIDTWTSRAWTHSKDAGDGTVPIISSSWIRARTVSAQCSSDRRLRGHRTFRTHTRGSGIHRRYCSSSKRFSTTRRARRFCARPPTATTTSTTTPTSTFAFPQCPELPGHRRSRRSPTLPRFLINAEGRGAFILKRAGIHHNVGNDIFRFKVTFHWSAAAGLHERS